MCNIDVFDEGNDFFFLSLKGREVKVCREFFIIILLPSFYFSSGHNDGA